MRLGQLSVTFSTRVVDGDGSTMQGLTYVSAGDIISGDATDYSFHHASGAKNTKAEAKPSDSYFTYTE